VEAVISELVSARLFPVLPGKYSEIRRILPVDDNGAPPSGCKFNRLAPEFPKHQISESFRLNREWKPSSRENAKQPLHRFKAERLASVIHCAGGSTSTFFHVL
jgi:hypothetical protein